MEWILLLTNSFDVKKNIHWTERLGKRATKPAVCVYNKLENALKLVSSKIPARVGKTSNSES